MICYAANRKAKKENQNIKLKMVKQTWPRWLIKRSLSSLSNYSSSRLGNVPKEKIDCVVIGAGIVGIAVARELALKLKREVLVVDSASSFGTATSSRNSEVVHAGIYYPRNSLKAVLCVRGRDLLYRYCSEHEIPHKKVGKLIVATGPTEIPQLNDIMNHGIQNEVTGLRMLDCSEAMQIEPELQCVKAILSPESGIVDSHSLMLSLVGDAENHGATFSYNTTIIGGHIKGNHLHICVSQSKDLENWDGAYSLQPELILSPKLVVNCAGLSAPAVARRFYSLNNDIIPPAYYARGCYFTLSKVGVSPFKRLIYPIPEEGGIGVHVTLDLNGQVKFGPDVEWIKGVDDISSFLNKYDYSVNANRAERFYRAVRNYFPNLKDGSLEPAYAGIRPKLSGVGQPPADFMIQGEETHGIRGLVNLFGIESPGLTASMAIAENVAARLSKTYSPN